MHLAMPVSSGCWVRSSRARNVSSTSAPAAYTVTAAALLVVLRVAAIYGPDRLGLARILTTMPVLAEGEANPGNRIHVDDLVKCCIAAMDCTNPEGTYNVSDGDYRSATWFAKRVARLSGLAEPPEVSRLEAERTFPARRLSFLAESRRLDITRMRDILGVQPRDPETGIRQSL
jgi:nucleoside-diphosphate-sugar epimerase